MYSESNHRNLNKQIIIQKIRRKVIPPKNTKKHGKNSQKSDKNIKHPL